MTEKAGEQELKILNNKEERIRGSMMFSIFEGILSTEQKQGQSVAPEAVGEMVVDKKNQQMTEEIAKDLQETIEVSVLKSDPEFDEIEEEWNLLLEKSEAHIFQTYEWQRIWWEHFRNNRHLHIITFRSRGQLVGIAPFFLDETWLFGFYTYRHLQFLANHIPEGGTKGAFTNYGPSDYLDLIVDPEYQEEVAETLISYLDENRDYFDQISLNELPEDGVVIQRVVPRIDEKGWTYEKEEREICPRIELPETIDKYLYMVKPAVRYKLRRSKRPVTDDNLYKVRDVKSDQDFESVFEGLVSLHQDRWNRQGYPGVFADKQFERFLKKVSKAFLQRGWLRLKSAFDHDGNCLAVDLTYAFNKRFYNYQKAFDDTSALASESPGHALTYFSIEDSINEEKEIFDLMRGGHRHKLRLASSAPQNWEVRIRQSAQKGVLKSRLYQLVSTISNIRLRILKELFLIRVHIRGWGAVGFIPKYTAFVKDRFKGEH